MNWLPSVIYIVSTSAIGLTIRAIVSFLGEGALRGSGVAEGGVTYREPSPKPPPKRGL